jgi:hypothetical protein
MAELVDALAIRRRLGRARWGAPTVYGPDGFIYRAKETQGLVIVTGWYEDGVPWLHASISRPTMPTYGDLAHLHYAVWAGNGYSHQVFAPEADHVNIHPRALHLWGKADGSLVLPNFARLGTI